jgi:hypothetical protein
MVNHGTMDDFPAMSDLIIARMAIATMDDSLYRLLFGSSQDWQFAMSIALSVSQDICLIYIYLDANQKGRLLDTRMI